MIVELLTLGVLVPAAVAAVAAAALTRIEALRGGGAAALALALGYVAGHLGVAGWVGWLPAAVTHRLPHLVLLAGVVGLAAIGPDGKARRLAPALAAPVFAWVLLDPLFDRWEAGTVAGALAGTTLALAAGAGLWFGALRRQPPLMTGAALAVAAGSLAVMSAASGSLVLGQLGGAVAAAVAAVALVSHLLRVELTLDAMVAVAAMALGGLAILAVAFSSTPYPPLLVWAAMPVVLWLVRTGAASRLRPALGATAQILVLVILGAAAAGWAALPESASEDSDAESPYDYGYGYE